MKTIKVKSGDTPTIRLKTLDANKAAVDITGYGLASLKIATHVGVVNADALYFISVVAASFSDGVNGIHDFVIPEDTTKGWAVGDYIYQVRLVDNAGVVTSTNTEVLIIEDNLIDHEV